MNITIAQSQAHLQGTQSRHTKANPDSHQYTRTCIVPFASESPPVVARNYIKTCGELVP